MFVGVPPHCLLVFCRWGWCRVCHVRLCVQVAGAAAVVAAVCLCCFWVFGCVAAAAVGSWVGAAPPSSVLAAGAVGHCGSTDASVAGSLACGVEEHAVLVSLWRRQRGLHSVAAAVPALELVGGCCGGCGGGWCGGGCGTSSQRVASAVAAAVVGGACWSASSVSLSLRAGEVTLVHASVCASVAGSLSVPSCVVGGVSCRVGGCACSVGDWLGLGGCRVCVCVWGGCGGCSGGACRCSV